MEEHLVWKNIRSGRIFGVENVFWRKHVWGEILFGAEKHLGQKTFWDGRTFGAEDHPGRRILGTVTYLGRKTISGEQRPVERKSFQDPGAEKFPGCQSGKL